MATRGTTKLRFERAAKAGRQLLSSTPLAISASYRSKRIHVELDNGCAFAVPVESAQGLADAKPADLKMIEVLGAGLGLYWPKLDADLYVPSLINGVLGTKQWMASIGTKGGKASTKAKALSSKANGKLGGRPKKTIPTTA